MNDVIIDIRNVRKKYRLGQFGASSLKEDLRDLWRKRHSRASANGSGAKEFYALDGIDLQIRRGETVGIIGRNGAGKSTLLKLLARVTAPTEGSIDMYGSVTSMLEVGTGFSPELTGRENIYINGAILGMKRSEVTRKMDEIIAFSSLEKFIDTPVKRYSSGMYTKLGFSVAVSLDSDIIIMDEVLAVGDAVFQNKCIEKMKKAASADGRTVLYVSHNMNHIRQLCSRCVVLDHGRILYDGDTDTAIETYITSSLNEETFFDYTDYARPDWLTDNRMRLISARYRKQDNILIGDGEAMQLTLKWKCLKDLEKIGLRIEVQSLQEQRLGTYVLYDICDGRAGEVIETDLEIDVSAFRENTYKVIYCFFNSSQIGDNLNLDRVEGLAFTRVHSNAPGELIWDFSEWGSLLPGKAEVVAVRKS